MFTVTIIAEVINLEGMILRRTSLKCKKTLRPTVEGWGGGGCV